MRNKGIIITALLLVVTSVTNLTIVSKGNARLVDTVSSFAMGVLTGILILQIARLIADKKTKQ